MSTDHQPTEAKTTEPDALSVALFSARMTLMRGTPEEIKRDLAAIDAKIATLTNERDAFRTALAMVYANLRLSEAGVMFEARFASWEVDQIRALLNSPNAEMTNAHKNAP